MINRLILVVVISSFLAASGMSQAVAPPQQSARPVQEVIETLYVGDFRTEIGLTQEQFLDVLPELRQAIRSRFKLAQDRETLKQRRNQLIGQTPSNEDVQLFRQMDQLERRALNSERNFLNKINPKLSPKQQAMVQAFQKRFFEEKLPQLIEQVRARNEARAAQKQQQPAKQQPRPAQPNKQRGGAQTDAFREKQR